MSTIKTHHRYTKSRLNNYFRGGRSGHSVLFNPPLRDVVAIDFTGLKNKRNQYYLTNFSRMYSTSMYINLYNGSTLVSRFRFYVSRGRFRRVNLVSRMRRRYPLRNLTISKIEFRGDFRRGRDVVYSVDNTSTFAIEQKPRVSLNVSAETFASHVKLDWTDPELDRLQYRVLYGGRVVSPTSYDTSAVISSLIPGRRYTYQIQYYESSWTTVTTINVTTKGSRVHVVEKGSTYMKIRWDPAYAGAHYIVKLIDVASGQHEEVETQDVEYLITGINWGRKYTIQVLVVE